MTTRTRDTLALYAIATLAVLAVLYADADLAQLFGLFSPAGSSLPGGAQLQGSTVKF